MAVARLELPLAGHHALYWLTGRDGRGGAGGGSRAGQT
jgi:hypothetical protein